MIIGAILQTASFGYPQMIVARIVTGIGNGLNVSAGTPYLTPLNVHHRLRLFLPTTRNVLLLQTVEA